VVFHERTGPFPRKVVLFSGHMIDKPGRSAPRFPASKEKVAASEIGRTLDQIGAAGDSDLAICGGACGGDLLFAEAAIARKLRLALYLPLPEKEFLVQSVDFANADWHERYLKAKAVAEFHVTPDELGPADEDPFERNNLRMLDVAMSLGAEKLDFVCLWNGEGGDGPGGTQHLMQAVQRKGGKTHWLDTTKLRA
jgi:hypothetical protein